MTRQPTPSILDDVLTTDASRPTAIRNASIKIDGGTQMRAQLDPATVQEYADAMAEAGWGKFPPIIAYYDGSDYWLADGFHRLSAWRSIANWSDAMIPADVRSGTRRDAILHAAGANASHGLRRTNADKRRAVETLLRDEEWAAWSNMEIARRCNVDEGTVRKVRKDLESASEIPKVMERHGADGKTYATANIGAKQSTTARRYFVDDLRPIVTNWAEENWPGQWPENPSHTNGTFWQQLTTWLHANVTAAWYESDLKFVIKQLAAARNFNPTTQPPAQTATDTVSPTLTTAEAAELLRPTIDDFYQNDNARRYRVADMRAGAQACTGGFWRACERTLANYTYTPALLANAIRLLADELNAADDTAPRPSPLAPPDDRINRARILINYYAELCDACERALEREPEYEALVGTPSDLLAAHRGMHAIVDTLTEPIAKLEHLVETLITHQEAA